MTKVKKTKKHCGRGPVPFDPFSKAVAEALIRKRNYTDKDLAALVTGLQKSPGFKGFMKKNHRSNFNKLAVYKLRREMDIGSVGHYHYPKGLGSKIDPTALRMVRNLIWATNLSAKKISKITGLVGKPVSRQTIENLMHEEGRVLRKYSKTGVERNKRIHGFAKEFKTKSMAEKHRIWTKLNEGLQLLKKAHSLEKNPEEKERLTEKMSSLFEMLQALEPLLSERIMNQIREKLSDDMAKDAEKWDN